MKTNIKAVLSAFALALALSSGSARAEIPMIEIGAGAESEANSEQINLVLHLGFGVTPDNPKGEGQIVFAQMSADLAFNLAEDGAQIPFADIRFIPSRTVVGTLDRDGILNGTGYSALPVSVTRDVRLDEHLNVTVAVLGVQSGEVDHSTDKIAVYAQVVADALGYKAASYVSDHRDFHGLHLGTLGAEVGVLFKPHDQFKVRLALGGQADLNLTVRETRIDGGLFEYHEQRWAAQSDMRAYAEARVHLAKFIQLFARGSLNGAWTQEENEEGALEQYIQLMGGIAILY